MSDRMNIASWLQDEFPQLTDQKITTSMKSLKPTDTVAILRVTMKNGGLDGRPIRHVPIIESDPNNPNTPNTGELKALISKLDLDALLSPPWDLIPQQIIDKKQIPIANLAQAIAKVARQPIKEAFRELFEKTKFLSTNSELGQAIELLSERQEFGNKTRRYRTIPIFNNQNRLVGMLSYYNFLEEISKRQEHKKYLQKKVSELLIEIGQKKEDIFRLERARPLFEASAVFEGAPFTHIPLTEDEENSSTVTGIVDDVEVKKYEHHLLLNAFSEMPLSSIETKINLPENTVTKETNLEDVINKFLKPERPTALLVVTEQNNKFSLQGIISYIDILRNFKKTFLEGSSNVNNSDA